MFSLSQATTAAAMRPGLVSGRYPERGDAQSAWIDRAFSALQGRLVGLSIDRRAGLRKVAAAIGRQGKELTDQNTAQLNHLRIELRHRLRSRYRIQLGPDQSSQPNHAPLVRIESRR